MFSPHFPTYGPNIARRGARLCLSNLKAERAFRPNLDDVAQFLEKDPSPKAVFLNSPHNPTGGVAQPEDLAQLAALIRGRDVAVFSDEPYDRMVWEGRHHSLLAEPGMLDHTVAAYTFSKSFSMSGWRLGFAVSSKTTTELIQTLTKQPLCLVCRRLRSWPVSPPCSTTGAYRDQRMGEFRSKVELLVEGLQQVDGVSCFMPGGTFYVFPSVAAVCNRLWHHVARARSLPSREVQTTGSGLPAWAESALVRPGSGFLRLSCAEPDERLRQAVSFMADAITRTERVTSYLAGHPEHRLAREYALV